MGVGVSGGELGEEGGSGRKEYCSSMLSSSWGRVLGGKNLGPVLGVWDVGRGVLG
jgi:hypothetical protein